MQAESPEEVPFIVRPEPLPFLLACVAAAAGAAAAVFYGATLAAVAWLAAALVLERVSRRAVPLPDDILAFAPPTNVLGGGDGSGGGTGSAGEERLSQAIQTVMRRHGIEEPYEKLKALTRGQEIDAESLARFVEGLDLPAPVKAELSALTPARYTGIAAELAKRFAAG